MIYDYNIIFENDEYYIYADKFPDINSSFNWETAQKEIIEEFEFVVGPSGKLVDVQEERNNENYIINKSTVSKKKIYENFEDCNSTKPACFMAGGTYSCPFGSITCGS